MDHSQPTLSLDEPCQSAQHDMTGMDNTPKGTGQPGKSGTKNGLILGNWEVCETNSELN